MHSPALVTVSFLCVFLILIGWGVSVWNVQASATAQVQATIQVSVCGNNLIETDEQCDRNDLRSQTCQTVGFVSGALQCSPGCTFDASACVSVNGGGGGGGGGGSIIPLPVPVPVTTSTRVTTGILFEGSADPLIDISLLKDGQIVTTGRTDDRGQFSFSLIDLTPGSYSFSLIAQNAQGAHSSPQTFFFVLTPGTITKVQKISLPSLEPVSSTSPSTSVESPPAKILRGDFNEDARVNLIDFSMAAYWYQRAGTPPAQVDLNRDGKIDLADFSIIAFYWTG
ncbi:hypothetical protein EXS71_03925 [Candidatus Uhrbacteria bacterium]|nr:hypothetical protein [Candidatus Uhrbacteria bacterium]